MGSTACSDLRTATQGLPQEYEDEQDGESAFDETEADERGRSGWRWLAGTGWVEHGGGGVRGDSPADAIRSVRQLVVKGEPPS